MQLAPLVSVIVPTRNSARTLEACLKSIRAQLYEPIEVLVIDNNSSDETGAIASKYAEVTETFGPERSAQRNRGAELSKGVYLLFIDSDMSLTPGVVGDCVETLQHAGVPAAIVPEISVGEGFLTRCRALERSCYTGDDSVEAARFFSREAFEDSGGFDEHLTGPEDWDLSRRVAAGQHLPRTRSVIVHDEGKLRLGDVLAKKRYYAASSLNYWRKHGRASLGQANVVLRPAFVRNWRRLLRQPILTAGILTLKTLEAGALLTGLVQAWGRSLAAGGAGRPVS